MRPVELSHGCGFCLMVTLDECTGLADDMSQRRHSGVGTESPKNVRRFSVRFCVKNSVTFSKRLKEPSGQPQVA